MSASNKEDYAQLNAEKPSNESYSGERNAAIKPKRSLFADLRLIGYHIGKRIGDGAYSKVYRAEYTKHSEPKTFSNVPIACKIIDTRYKCSELLEKFLPRELNIVQRISHPYIVTMHAIVKQGPFMCCFMEFCKHGDLLEYILDHGKLSAEFSRKYFSQIAGAVRYLHVLGIAHRDIKCENVLIQSPECVKLTDFGFARQIDFDRKGKLVLSDTYCGSEAYTAPEVLKRIAYDPRLSDMWSLGCLLYIMVTGGMPFDDQNLAATIKKQERRDILYPAETNVTNDVKNIIKGLLEPDVNIRTSSATLMHEPWVTLV